MKGLVAPPLSQSCAVSASTSNKSATSSAALLTAWRWRSQAWLARLSRTSAASTRAMARNGRATPRMLSTTAIVTIWPITAIQRSWISRSMFLRLAVSETGRGKDSDAITSYPGVGGGFSGRGDRAGGQHQRQAEPGQRIDEMVVGEGDDCQP